MDTCTRVPIPTKRDESTFGIVSDGLQSRERIHAPNAGRYRDFERSTPSPLEQGGKGARVTTVEEKREGRLGESRRAGGGKGGGVTSTSHDTASPSLPPLSPLSIGSRPCVLFFSS